jgi:hypothetical protein
VIIACIYKTIKQITKKPAHLAGFLLNDFNLRQHKQKFTTILTSNIMNKSKTWFIWWLLPIYAG